jgi:hypothetical protein
MLAVAVALIAIHVALQQSYYLVMATQLALPWLLYAWLAHRGPVGVFLAWMWSSIVSYILSTGYFGYTSLMNRTTAVATACIIGTALFVVIATHRPEMLVKNERPLAVFVYGFVVAYSYAGIFQVNCLLDRSSITIYRPVVLEKVYGFRRARGLLVESWSPEQRLSMASLFMRRGAAMVPPSRELFETTRKGDTICVLQRKGRLGMSWYTSQLGSWTGGKDALGPWDGRY